MIITENFVMLNFPKTGSTFVRNVLKEIHSKYADSNTLMHRLGLKKKPYFENLWLPSVRSTFREPKPDEHGIYSQIPEIHRDKTVVSVKRDLFERLVSVYNFGNWKRSPWMDVEVLKKDCPEFPDISFKDFVYLWNKNNPLENHKLINRKLPIGPATSQFILFYFKEPFEVLKNIDLEYVNSDRYKEDMAEVEFLDQANLNEELYAFLKRHNYKHSEISFILKAEKQNVSTSDADIIKDYYDEELLEYINGTERLMLRIMDGL